MAAKRCILKSARAKRAAWMGVAAAVVLLALLVSLPRPTRAPDFSDALKKASEGLTAYDYALSLDADHRTLIVTATMDYVNRTGDTLDSLLVRTYAGAFAAEETSPAAMPDMYDTTYPEGFSVGGVTMAGAWWNGGIARSAFVDDAQTALSVDIAPLKDGERGTLTLRLSVAIPVCAYRLGVMDGVWALGNALPILSVWENGAWRDDPYEPIGDPFLSECANYSVRLTLPEGFTPVCTARLTLENGVWVGRALAVRDLALVIYEQCVVRERVEGGVTITSCALTEMGAERALNDAARALRVLGDLYGAYPYPTYAVCQTPFPFDGMEYPSLCMIGSGKYLDSQRDSLELVIAHETAHQWFYALVGSDQINQPWQDEGVCEYAVLRYAEKRYGKSSADLLRSYRVDAPMRESVPGDLTPASPLSYFGDYTAYHSVVYGRGAAFILAADAFLSGGMDALLREYCARFAFQIASREDLIGLLSERAERDVVPLAIDYLDTAM